MTRSTVEVPRGLLIALAAAAAAGVLAATFLVGREAGRGPQAASPPTITLAPAAEVPPGRAGGPAAEASPAIVPAIEPPPASAPMAAPTGTSWPSMATPAPAAAPHDALRNDVASYFREVETIQSQAKSAGDPQALAQTLLEQAGKGDMTGFDGLVGANQRVRDALHDLAVPEPCREHHRLTLALLDESIAMLGRVKGQLQGADAVSLAAMPAEGQALERKAKEVDAMAAEIKRRFGL